MPLYDESTVTESVTTKEWTRANLVTVDNPINLPQTITYVEERARQIGDGTPVAVGNVGSVSKTLGVANASTQFDLLNPETGDVIGSATYQDMQVMIYSLYFALATERDNAQ